MTSEAVFAVVLVHAFLLPVNFWRDRIMMTGRKLSQTQNLAESLGLLRPQPYAITAITNDGATPVAAVVSPGIAFAVYYAAIREYLGARVRLSLGEHILAMSRV